MQSPRRFVPSRCRRAIWFFPVFLAAFPGRALAAGDDLFVSQIAIDPADPRRLYGLTTYSVGLLKSADGGESWRQINEGIQSYSLYQVAVNPKTPGTVYIGAGGAGLYRSTDGGGHWREMNDGLQNTDIGMLAFHPDDSEIVYAVTSTGLFKSPDGGVRWEALNQGDDFTTSQQFQGLAVVPTQPPTFFLGSSKGLYTRREGDGGWVPVRGGLEGRQISAVARDPRTGRLFGAVLRRAGPDHTEEGGLFVSGDQGQSWIRLGAGLERDWIRVIQTDPSNPRVLYLATSGRGVLKSLDGGETWAEANRGLDDPNRDIRALAMDPRNPAILYAGSHGRWIYKTEDGAGRWRALSIGPHRSGREILDGLNRADAQARPKAGRPRPPKEFQKCNSCHGWTDPSINQLKGSWRISPNRRDWARSVHRMSAAARLTPSEEAVIAGFLNEYTRTGNGGDEGVKTDGGPGEIVISLRPGSEEEDPVAAFDGRNYLVVWQSNRAGETDYNLYARRYDADGHPVDVDERTVSAAPSNQIFPSIVYGGGQYLAVWQDLRGRRRWEIYAARIRVDGTVMDPEGIRIAQGEGNAEYPQVSWDGKNFMAVWMEERRGAGWEVAGARISPQGRLLDAGGIRIAAAPGDQDHPALAWGGDAYWVVWSDGGSGGPAKLSGARVSASGRLPDPRPVTLSTSPETAAHYPAAAWDGSRFLAVWTERIEGAEYVVSASRLKFGAGGMDRQDLRIAADPIFRTFPSVACGNSRCLAVWEEGGETGGRMEGITDIHREVRGAWISGGVGPAFWISADAVGNHFAKIATDGRRFLVVWKDYRTGRAAILGRLLTPPSGK